MVDIFQADLSLPHHADAFIQLLDSYARDPMGGGRPLNHFTRHNIIASLQQRSNAVVVLAMMDSTPAGLINCFEGFSTFACKPLLNIHDVIVSEQFRGQGISQAMLKQVESIAQHRGCCKLTLEVLEKNTAAKAAYQKFGFRAYQLDPEYGRALFWEKEL